MRFLPSEVKARFVIPAVRKELSKKMSEKGLSQTEIANELGLTQSAVSQYLRNKRAVSKLEINPDLDNEMELSVNKIMDSNSGSTAALEIMRICDILKEKGIMCDIHRREDNPPENCDLC